MIALILPFLLPLSLVALTGVGVAASWWFDLADWQTALIFGAALASCIYMATSNSVIAKFVIPVILFVAGYLKGGHDMDVKLTAQHKIEIAAIHQKYKDATDAEVERQNQVNKEASERAEEAKKTWEAERIKLRGDLKQLSEEAARDKSAERPGLGPDAIDRINRLRWQRKPSQLQRGGS
jgi:cytochrome c556